MIPRTRQRPRHDVSRVTLRSRDPDSLGAEYWTPCGKSGSPMRNIDKPSSIQRLTTTYSHDRSQARKDPCGQSGITLARTVGRPKELMSPAPWPAEPYRITAMSPPSLPKSLVCPSSARWIATDRPSRQLNKAGHKGRKYFGSTPANRFGQKGMPQRESGAAQRPKACTNHGHRHGRYDPNHRFS